MKLMRSLWFPILAAICLPSAIASAADADAVTVNEGKIYSITGDSQELLTADQKFANEIVVSTNGTFRVADGNDRKLGEGQILRRDGWLIDTDGSAQPAIDHVAMLGAKVMIFREGQPSRLQQTMTFSNKLVVTPDGSCVYPGGAKTRLVDGQLFRLDGTSIDSKDTVSLKNGQVVVQKSGKLLPLKPVQIMGMEDGTRIYGTGRIEKRDGTTLKLREGQTILIDGAAIRR